MAVEPIREGEPIRKFGQIIGFATSHRAGRMGARTQYRAARIRSATTASPRTRRTTGFCRPDARHLRGLPPRPNGKTGTRNYIGVLTSVNCSASVANFSPARSSAPACSTIIRTSTAWSPIVHGTGCGHGRARRGLRRPAPDAMGLCHASERRRRRMVGLGCEVFQIDRMKKEYGLSGTTSSAP